MNKWNPIKRKEFIRRLKKLDFSGPYIGSRHQFMIFKNHRLAIPSNEEYSVPQLKMMIHEVQEIMGKEVSSEEWNNL